MMVLSDGRKSFPIGLAVLIQYRSVTAIQLASHVAVAITLNAKASSLKSIPYQNRLTYELQKQLCSRCLRSSQVWTQEMRENEYRDPKGRVSNPKGRGGVGSWGSQPPTARGYGSVVNFRSGVWDGTSSEIKIVTF